MRKLILYVVIFAIFINTVFSQEVQNNNNTQEEVFTPHTVSIDFAPFFMSLGLLGVLGFVGAPIAIADAFSGNENNNELRFFGGLGFSYDYALDKRVTLGANLDFAGADIGEFNFYILSLQLGSKFFVNNKALTPKGFYLETSISSSYIHVGTEDIFGLGATVGLGWRLIFSPPSKHFKLGMDIGLGAGYQYAVASSEPPENPNDRHLPMGYWSLTLNMNF